MSERPRPLEELDERRDELVEELMERLDVCTELMDVHFEIDNELADHNHMAVVQHVEHAVGLLSSLEALDLHELAHLTALVITGTERGPRARRWDEPVPTDPVIRDAAAFALDPDDYDDENEAEQAYTDAVAEAGRAAVDSWAWHLRHLLRYASDLAGGIVGAPEERLGELIGRRDETVAALARAVKAWEVALAGDMEANGSTWQVAAFETWLDSTRDAR